MPTLPLFDQVTAPDFTHRVRAPGGYEQWRFAVYDSRARAWITVLFHHGYPSRHYLRRYFRYRRWPTHHAPPVPAESSTIVLEYFAGDRFLRSTCPIGDNHLNREATGAIRLQGPQIDLTFRANSLAPARAVLDLQGGAHHWLMTDCLCHVTGTLRIANLDLEVSGNGFHDQRFGTAPIQGRCFSGYVFSEDRLQLFYQLNAMHVATIRPDSIAIESAISPSGPTRLTRRGLAYPKEFSLNDGSTLVRPKIVSSNWLHAQLVYEATGNGGNNLAYCQISSPQRIAWPMLGTYRD